MNRNSPVRPTEVGRSAVLKAVLAVVSGGILLSQIAIAAVPAAGTNITNQATATYLDGSGSLQLATSNAVTTVVQQVGAYTLTPTSNTKSAAAGATVYTPYVLTNTGNGTDSFVVTASEAVGGADFSRIEVYLDADENGQPDSTTALCTSTTAGAVCSIPARALPAGGKLSFVVAYQIPTTAVAGAWGGGVNTANVTVAPVASALVYAAPSIAATDTVNLVTTAAFSMNQSIGAPSVASTSAAPSPGTWPTTASGQRGTVTTYTLNFTNNGAVAGNLYLRNALPSGLTYQPGTAVWSSNGGNALTEASGGDTNMEFEASAGVIQALIPSINPGVTGTLSFKVAVSATAAMGTTDTSNLASFSATGCAAVTTIAGAGASGASCGGMATTNAAAFTVLATNGVTLNVLDPTPNSGTPGTGLDIKTATQIVPGGSATFTHVVTNSGNAPDSINLSVATAGNTFPAGTTYAWFTADGSTPLLDTTGDGIVDTGPIAANASVTAVLRVTLPSSTAVAAGANLTVVALARSFGDPTKVDAASNVVTNVIGSLVDVTNTAAGTGIGNTANGDKGPGPSPAPTLTTTTTAGVVAPIALFVRNNDSVANTYALAASQVPVFPGNLPAGWTATFSTSNTCSAGTITTVSVAAGAQATVYACVTAPASSPSVANQPVYFQVLSTGPASTGGTVGDIVHDAVTVSSVVSQSFALLANGSGQVAPNGSLTFAHTLTNTGTNSCGAFNVSAAPTAGALAAGWATAIYVDVNNSGTIDTGDTLVTDGTLPALTAAGQTKLLVRVFAPGGAITGNSEVVTVTIADQNGSAPTGCGTQTVTDTSTVVSGSIGVLKSQSMIVGACPATPVALGTQSAASLQALPGSCIVYQVTATNNGTAPVTNVTLNDAAPARTTLSAGQPAAACTSTNLTGTAVTYSVTGTTVACGSTSNTLAPGGTVVLRFAVQIDN
jgi:uncharacterized repeat protein (TIGR01451 family)